MLFAVVVTSLHLYLPVNVPMGCPLDAFVYLKDISVSSFSIVQVITSPYLQVQVRIVCAKLLSVSSSRFISSILLCSRMPSGSPKSRILCSLRSFLIDVRSLVISQSLTLPVVPSDCILYFIIIVLLFRCNTFVGVNVSTSLSDCKVGKAHAFLLAPVCAHHCFFKLCKCFRLALIFLLVNYDFYISNFVFGTPKIPPLLRVPINTRVIILQRYSVSVHLIPIHNLPTLTFNL